MNTSQIKTKKQEIRNCIASDKIKVAFDKSFLLPKENLREQYDSLILLSGRYESIKQDRNLGILDDKYVNTEMAKIRHDLLKTINKIPDIAAHQPTQKKTNEDLRNKLNSLKRDDRFKYDLFFSYSTNDSQKASKIWETLRGNGLKVFISEEAMKLNPGISFHDKIENALITSKNFLLFCTKNALQSDWVKTEYQTFYNQFFMKDKSRKFYILKSKELTNTEVPLLLRNLQIAENTDYIIKSIIQEQFSYTNQENIDQEQESSTNQENIEREQHSYIRKEVIDQKPKSSTYKKNSIPQIKEYDIKANILAFLAGIFVIGIFVAIPYFNRNRENPVIMTAKKYYWTSFIIVMIIYAANFIYILITKQ